MAQPFLNQHEIDAVLRYHLTELKEAVAELDEAVLHPDTHRREIETVLQVIERHIQRFEDYWATRPR